MESINLQQYFQGKVFIITGASSGIGRSVLHLLNSLGADLALIGRNIKTLQAARDSSTHPKNCQLYEFDLLHCENIDILFKSIYDDMGPLSGMVYSSGISPISPLRGTKYSRWDEVMRINLYSFMEMLKCYSSRRYLNVGSIVAISSTAATMPEKGQIMYAASKAALNAAVTAAAHELSEKNIRINAVMPGLIQTEMTEKFSTIGPDNFLQTQKAKQLLGLGTPPDIANFVIFLLSSMSAFCTGRSYYADGGRIV